MRYLIIGISVIILFGCGKTSVEYTMKVDLVYINQTDSVVSFDIFQAISSNNSKATIKLKPFSTSKIFSYNYDGVTEVVEPKTCCNSFLENVYSSREWQGTSKKIMLNDTLCITHTNENSTQIANYSYEIVTDRHFKYTYTFTSKDFINSQLCE